MSGSSGKRSHCSQTMWHHFQRNPPRFGCGRNGDGSFQRYRMCTRRCSGGGIGSFHRLNMSPLISQVESEIPIAIGEFPFNVKSGPSFFLFLNNLEIILGAMTVCGWTGMAARWGRTLYLWNHLKAAVSGPKSGHFQRRFHRSSYSRCRQRTCELPFRLFTVLYSGTHALFLGSYRKRAYSRLA